MIIKIADGSEVELRFGASKVFLVSDVFGSGTGPFLVVGEDGNLPVIELLAATEIDEAKTAPVSPELISAVATPDQKVDVRLPSGEIVRVDASIAPILEAFISANSALLDQLGRLLSGEEVAGLKRELEALRAERDAAVAVASRFRELLPVLDEASSALQKAIEGLKG